MTLLYSMRELVVVVVFVGLKPFWSGQNCRGREGLSNGNWSVNPASDGHHPVCVWGGEGSSRIR